MAGTSRRHSQLAVSVVDRADAAGVAREVGVTLRPRNVFYVTAGLRGGGAEAMLARLASAQPGVADDITIVSLLPAEAHMERLSAGGVRVVELRFDKAAGITTGLCRLTGLIAKGRPDIVQGWMYHGDLAALVALVLSGRRRQTRLVWSIRCTAMDWRGYGVGLWLVVKACALLSGWPDLVTANSVAGLKSHLALGYRPRRAEVVANGIDIEEFRPDAATRRAVRSELGIADDAIVLAHVARVDTMKDMAVSSLRWRSCPTCPRCCSVPVRKIWLRRITSFGSAVATTWRACSPPRISWCPVHAYEKDSRTCLPKEWRAGFRQLQPMSAM